MGIHCFCLDLNSKNMFKHKQKLINLINYLTGRGFKDERFLNIIEGPKGAIDFDLPIPIPVQ